MFFRNSRTILKIAEGLVSRTGGSSDKSAPLAKIIFDTFRYAPHYKKIESLTGNVTIRALACVICSVATNSKRMNDGLSPLYDVDLGTDAICYLIDLLFSSRLSDNDLKLAKALNNKALEVDEAYAEIVNILG
ncbi:hypothetical protein [Vibrio alfacsensis]|uniref:hypothetical protein n=1 Tax=Vibrio alfacsensis TaxID=1074311 RepID=UPI004068BF6A